MCHRILAKTCRFQDVAENVQISLISGTAKTPPPIKKYLILSCKNVCSLKDAVGSEVTVMTACLILKPELRSCCDPELIIAGRTE